MNIFIQIIGIAAMIFSVLSFQMNKHKQVMIMQIIASSLFGIQYLLLGAYTGLTVNMIATIRGIIFYNKDKKWASNNVWLIIFITSFIISGIFTWQGPSSLLIVCAMILNTFSFSFTKIKLVRTTILVSSPLILIYNILAGSIGGAISELCVEISSIIGLFRYDIKRNGHKCCDNKTYDNI